MKTAISIFSLVIRTLLYLVEVSDCFVEAWVNFYITTRINLTGAHLLQFTPLNHTNSPRASRILCFDRVNVRRNLVTNIGKFRCRVESWTWIESVARLVFCLPYEALKIRKVFTPSEKVVFALSMIPLEQSPIY